MFKQPASSAFTPREIARAAGVPTGDVLAALGCGDERGVLVSRTEAVELVRRLTAGLRTGAGSAPVPVLFARPARTDRPAGLPAAASGTVHAVALVAVMVLASVSMDSPSASTVRTTDALAPLRMVYLMTPGPGGGGGGGGRRDLAPAPKAERRGKSPVSSPVPERRPAPMVAPAETPAEAPKPVLAAEQLPPIIAPVVAMPGDARDRTGVFEASTADAESHGPGTGGGTGSGVGTGAGEGTGTGIGPGSGGGTGGGPYRPGSGVEPPTILREVRPTYTEAARQKGITGEVVLEIVVQRDGSVGAVRVLHGLGSGLDERAVEAVRQWRFGPARRLGQPVDVVVEVAVEFKLR
ncbi:MAG: energy transducer TonB [Acidobacteria bacterium]|nr:energy transducer TonB [Acidobacteriota bacterium]